MDRLTTRDTKGRALARVGGNSGLQIVSEYPKHDYIPHIDRLAAYEDIGAPEQLAERVKVVRCYECFWIGHPMPHSAMKKYLCTAHGRFVEPREYCSYGERRAD